MASGKSKNGKSGGKGNEHRGHRQRVKKKFLQNGLDIFEPHEALELYLFYAIPRRDTNPLAHRLLNRYINLSGVCDASFDELTKDFGLSENTAILLNILPGLSQRYIESKMSDDNIIDPGDLYRMFWEKLARRTDAAFAIVLGDAKGKMIYFGVIAEKMPDFEETPLSKIVNLSLRHHAKYVFIAHNRPDGAVLPTENDIKTARTVKEVLKNMGINLVDIYVVASKGCYSVRYDSQEGNEIFKVG